MEIGDTGTRHHPHRHRHYAGRHELHGVSVKRKKKVTFFIALTGRWSGLSSGHLFFVFPASCSSVRNSVFQLLRHTKLPERHRRRGRHIERINPVRHRDTDYIVGFGNRLVRKPVAFGAHHDGQSGFGG